MPKCPLHAAVPLALLASTLPAYATDMPAAARPTIEEAAARYGQALGASLVCPDAELLPAAAALIETYSGPDLERFKAVAQRVTLAWKKTLACDPTADINRCRVLNDLSCGEALKEIGPEGRVLPGLIAPRRRP